MIKNKIPVVGNNVKYLFLRGMVGFISLCCFFWVLQRIPLGSAISLRYLGPIFGAIMAVYFLREKVNKFQWLSFMIAFSGVAIIKGFDIRVDTLSFVLVMISAILVGAVFVVVRYLSDKEHFLTIINYFMMCCLAGSVFFLGSLRMPIGEEWYSVIGIGIFGMLGQICMTIAFQTEEASLLAPFKYMELVFALIFGYIIFNENYSFLPMIGIIMIVGGMVMNVWAKKSYKRN